MTLHRIAQRWQRTFPFKNIHDRPHGHESLVSFTGTMNGSPYWACYICGKPVLDTLTGEPITRKEHLPGYLPGENIPEEQSTGYVFTQQEYENIRQLFSEYMPKCIALVNKYFEYIKDEDVDTTSSISELFENINKLNYEIKSSLFDVLKKLEPILIDKGVINDDVAAIYKLLADINPDYYKFWQSYRIPQYVAPRDATLPSGDRIMFPEGNGALFEEKKNEIINYINKFGPILEKILNEYLKPYVGLEGVERASHEKRLHPICQTCFDENSYHCDDPDCDFISLDPDDVIDVKERKWVADPKQPHGGKYEEIHSQFCEEHGAKCESCGKGLEKGNDDTVRHGRDDYYHSDCYSEVFTTCDECGTEIFREDARWDDDNGVELCPNCYDEEAERKEGIEQGIPEDDLDTAREILTNQDKFYPLDADTIQKSVLPTIQLAIKHVSKNPIRSTGVLVEGMIPFRESKDYEEIENFIHKRLQKQETKAAVSIKLQDLYTQAVPSSRTEKVDWGQIMKDMEAFFIKNLEEMNRIKSEYPNLKGFKPYPVDIKIESGRNHGGSVFVIYPSAEFLEYASLIQPGASEAYTTYIKRKGHHAGALAYARFTLSKGNIIIDNLQTDIDAQAFDDDLLKSKPALQWWVSTIKKFWAPYLLDALRKFGQAIEKKVYLTNFDMQKIKWHSLPERNKDIYDRIPETMNMPTEKVIAKPEDLVEKKWDMRRVARKLTENIDEFVRLATE